MNEVVLETEDNLGHVIVSTPKVNLGTAEWRHNTTDRHTIARGNIGTR